MTSLRDTLTDPSRKTAVVTDLSSLIEGEVATMGGLSGIAAKTAFAAVKKKDATIVSRAAGAYLGPLADALGPHWDSFKATGGSDFGAYLTSNSAAVNASLRDTLKAEAPTSGSARGMYEKFEPQILKVMAGALPRLGAMVQKHAG